MLIDCSAHMGSPQESRGLTECVSRRSQSDVLMQSSVTVTELLLKVNVKCVWTLEERKKEEEKPHRRPLFAHLWFPDDEPWRPELRRNSSTFVLQDEFHSHYPQFKVGSNITQFLMTEQSLTELLINLQREILHSFTSSQSGWLMEPLRYELRHLRVGGITYFIICSLLFSLKSEGVDHRKGWTLGFGEELQDQGCLVHERGR